MWAQTLLRAFDSITNSLKVTANAGSNLNTSTLALSSTQTDGTQKTQINNGSNTAAVKAASTLAVATDPALVVSISPNNTPVLPLGAATSVNQTTIGNQTTKINDGTNTMAVKAASTSPLATDPSAVVALSPNGNQAKDSSVTGLQVIQGSTTSGQSGSLVQGAVSTNQPSYTNAQTSPLSLTIRGGIRAKVIGLDTVTLLRNDYSSVNVTTSAYVQLIASTSLEINRLHIFDSSGQDLVLAVGAAGLEVNQIQIPPGGWDAGIELYIPASSRISIKAISANATGGLLLITGLK